jgi:hypothetical protein
MVDLQRSIGYIWNIIRVRIQAGRENSDAGTSPAMVLRENFSHRDSSENFIRADLS